MLYKHGLEWPTDLVWPSLNWVTWCNLPLKILQNNEYASLHTIVAQNLKAWDLKRRGKNQHIYSMKKQVYTVRWCMSLFIYENNNEAWLFPCILNRKERRELVLCVSYGANLLPIVSRKHWPWVEFIGNFARGWQVRVLQDRRLSRIAKHALRT